MALRRSDAQAARRELVGAQQARRVLTYALPHLGTLVREADTLQVQLTSQRGSSVPGASALTAAELRLLPQLSTHLSFPEIAQDMVSRHTIKSQAVSIYRKLDATSRSQAITKARDVGLLEG